MAYDEIKSTLHDWTTGGKGQPATAKRLDALRRVATDHYNTVYIHAVDADDAGATATKGVWGYTNFWQHGAASPSVARAQLEVRPLWRSGSLAVRLHYTGDTADAVNNIYWLIDGQAHRPGDIVAGAGPVLMQSGAIIVPGPAAAYEMLVTDPVVLSNSIDEDHRFVSIRVQRFGSGAEDTYGGEAWWTMLEVIYIGDPV